jgi:hypothetical protein
VLEPKEVQNSVNYEVRHLFFYRMTQEFSLLAGNFGADDDVSQKGRLAFWQRSGRIRFLGKGEDVCWCIY